MVFGGSKDWEKVRPAVGAGVFDCVPVTHSNIGGGAWQDIFEALIFIDGKSFEEVPLCSS